MKQFVTDPFSFNVHDNLYGSTQPKYIKSYDGINLAYYHMKAKSLTKAIIIFIHGAGAHGYMSDYQNIGNKLSEKQISSYFIDIRGHGNSDGIRGAAGSKEVIWKDIRKVIEYVRNQNLNIPVYLTGHSSGAGTVINYATWNKRVECDGYIFISPYFGYRAKSYRNSMFEDNFAQAQISHFVINGLSFGLLFGNKTSVYYNYPKKQVEKDPLIITSITCNMSKSCTLWNPIKQFSIIKKPIGLYIGSEDELFDPDKVVAYTNYLNNKIKQNSCIKIITKKKHLSILTIIDEYIIAYIEKRLTTAST
jgi:acylglycerol lipase